MRTRLLLLLVFICIMGSTFAQLKDADPTFGTNGTVQAPLNGQFTRLVVQPDGKLLAAGVTIANNVKSVFLARYNTDGTLDNTFSGDGLLTGYLSYTLPADGEEHEIQVPVSIAVGSDGKIVMLGSLKVPEYSYDFAVFRFNANGTPDNTFDGDGKVTTDIKEDEDPFFTVDYASSVAVQTNGQIVAVGQFKSDAGRASWGRVVYNQNGSLFSKERYYSPAGEPAFTPFVSSLPGGGHAVSVTPDLMYDFYSTKYGKKILDYPANGSHSQAIEHAVLPDGSVIALGKATMPLPAQGEYGYGHYLARLKPNGELDGSFGEGGFLSLNSFATDDPANVVTQPNGQILISTRYTIKRYDSDGSLESSFTPANAVILDLALSEKRVYASNGSSITAVLLNPLPPVAITWYRDWDGDEFGNPTDTIVAVEQPEGYITEGRDCDDTDFNVNPGTPEMIDGKDNNCNGLIDEGFAPLTITCPGDTTVTAEPGCKYIPYTNVLDPVTTGLGDIWIDYTFTGATTGKGGGTLGDVIFNVGVTTLTFTANDEFDRTATCSFKLTVLPADEICTPPSTIICPADITVTAAPGTCTYTFGENSPPYSPLISDDTDFYYVLTGATNSEASGAIGDVPFNVGVTTVTYVAGNPSGKEVSCSFTVTVKLAKGGGVTTWYRDADGDSFGDPNNSVKACSRPEGYEANALDCDDTDEHKGGGEIGCDGIDNDCDGIIDNIDLQVLYKDTDKDGYGDNTDTGQLLPYCLFNDGGPYAIRTGDCDDEDDAVNPDMMEVCGDGKDNNCDGQIDEGCGSVTTWFRDADGDGFGNGAQTKTALTQPRGYVSNALDCNDKDSKRGGPEVCDGRDNDCDGIIDEGFALKTFYSDFDGDGWGSLKRTLQACAAPPRYVSNTGDCDDVDNTVYPGAPELCDGKDNDCNGKRDDGLTMKPFYWDGDGDGYGYLRPVYACAAPRGYIAIGGDCNDEDPRIHPGAVGSPGDGIDNNCNGLIDESLKTGMVQKGLRMEEEPALKLQLTAAPNPATHYFTLRIQSTSNKLVQLRIVDVMGRVVEVRPSVPAGSTVAVGQSYKPGVYYAEAMQEGKRITVKLVKTAL